MKVSILSLKGLKVPAVGYCWHAIHDVQILITNIFLNRLLQLYLLVCHFTDNQCDKEHFIVRS